MTQQRRPTAREQRAARGPRGHPERDPARAKALRQAEQRFQRAAARADEAREARNQLVRSALAAGWTNAEVARVTGLSPERVRQLAT